MSVLKWERGGEGRCGEVTGIGRGPDLARSRHRKKEKKKKPVASKKKFLGSTSGGLKLNPVNWGKRNVTVYGGGKAQLRGLKKQKSGKNGAIFKGKEWRFAINKKITGGYQCVCRGQCSVLGPRSSRRHREARKRWGSDVRKGPSPRVGSASCRKKVDRASSRRTGPEATS